MGFSIIKKEDGSVELLYSENFKINKKEFIDKTKIILKKLEDILNNYKIDIVVLEEGYLGKNVYSMDILSKIRGVVYAFFVMHDISIKTYSPSKIKKSITGNGNASKEQILKSVSLLLNIKNSITYDEADAIAIAYTYALELRSEI